MSSFQGRPFAFVAAIAAFALLAAFAHAQSAKLVPGHEFWRDTDHAAANSLFLLARAEGVDVTYESFLRSFGDGLSGAGLQDVKKAARSLALDLELYTIEDGRIRSVPRPFVAHLDPMAGDYCAGGRFVVVRAVRGEDVAVVDAMTAIENVMPLHEFRSKLWSGVVLVKRLHGGAAGGGVLAYWLACVAALLLGILAARLLTSRRSARVALPALLLVLVASPGARAQGDIRDTVARAFEQSWSALRSLRVEYRIPVAHLAEIEAYVHRKLELRSGAEFVLETGHSDVDRPYTQWPGLVSYRFVYDAAAKQTRITSDWPNKRFFAVQIAKGPSLHTGVRRDPFFWASGWWPAGASYAPARPGGFSYSVRELLADERYTLRIRGAPASRVAELSWTQAEAGVRDRVFLEEAYGWALRAREWSAPGGEVLASVQVEAFEKVPGGPWLPQRVHFVQDKVRRSTLLLDRVAVNRDGAAQRNRAAVGGPGYARMDTKSKRLQQTHPGGYEFMDAAAERLRQRRRPRPGALARLPWGRLGLLFALALLGAVVARRRAYASPPGDSAQRSKGKERLHAS